jgi:hypothetical protein
MKCNICETSVAEVNKSLTCRDCNEEILEAMHRHEKRVDELKSVISIILQADALREHAFDRGDDDASIYELCKHAVEEL